MTHKIIALLLLLSLNINADKQSHIKLIFNLLQTYDSNNNPITLPVEKITDAFLHLSSFPVPPCETFQDSFDGRFPIKLLNNEINILGLPEHVDKTEKNVLAKFKVFFPDENETTCHFRTTGQLMIKGQATNNGSPKEFLSTLHFIEDIDTSQGFFNLHKYMSKAQQIITDGTPHLVTLIEPKPGTHYHELSTQVWTWKQDDTYEWPNTPRY